MRRRTPPAPIDPALADILLHVHRTSAEVHGMHAAGIDYDGFLIFEDWPYEQAAELWREHGAWLRAEARRRGVAVPERYR